MKNWIKSMFVMLCGMMIATTFVACGDDDDDENGSVTAKSLVGTWKGVMSETYNGKTYTWTECITLNSDKSGKEFVIESNGEVYEVATFTWSLSGNTVTYTYTWVNNDVDEIKVGDTESSTIISVNSTTLVINVKGKKLTLTKAQ